MRGLRRSVTSPRDPLWVSTPLEESKSLYIGLETWREGIHINSARTIWRRTIRRKTVGSTFTENVENQKKRHIRERPFEKMAGRLGKIPSFSLGPGT